MYRGFSSLGQRVARQAVQRSRVSTSQRTFTTGQATTATQTTRTTATTTSTTTRSTTTSTSSTTVGGRQQQQQQSSRTTTGSNNKNQQQNEKTSTGGRRAEQLVVGTAHRSFQALLANASKVGGLAALSSDAYILTHYGAKDDDV